MSPTARLPTEHASSSHGPIRAGPFRRTPARIAAQLPAPSRIHSIALSTSFFVPGRLLSVHAGIYGAQLFRARVGGYAERPATAAGWPSHRRNPTSVEHFGDDVTFVEAAVRGYRLPL